MTNFDAATAVTARGPSRFAARLFPEWAVGSRPHGGYLMAILARAAGLAVLADQRASLREVPVGAADPAELDAQEIRAVPARAGDGAARPGTRPANLPDSGPRLPQPLAASAHFMSPPEFGDGEITTRVLRVGRRLSQVRTSLVQEGKERVEMLLTLGPLAGDVEPSWADVPPVELPAFADCVSIAATQPGAVTVMRTLDVAEVRLDPACAGFLSGRAAGHAELRGWLRLLDGREPDPFSLLFVLDAFPPATFEIGSVGWVPTLELTSYVRALPAEGPLRVRQRARLVEAGLVDESCDVWDSRGRLVAQATQLAAVRLAADAEPVADPGRVA